jgi:hypothetical protein
LDLSFLSRNEEMIVMLLSASIRGGTLNSECNETVEWNIIFDMACQHEVMTLIYPLLNNIASVLAIPQPLLKKWQSAAMIEAIDQERNYNAIGSVLQKLSLAGIPVIALKGLVLRDLYPYPNLRTMSDFDLLVKPDDMKHAHDILTNCGYKVESLDGKHTVYINEESLLIELHKYLIPENFFTNYMSFETNIWNRARLTEICGSKVMALNHEDEFIYLMLHMASHIKNEGFGMRQLCDIVLFHKSYSHLFNLNSLIGIARNLKIETFMKTIMSLCNVLFKTDINRDIQLPTGKQNEELIVNMIKYIIQGGVYGYQSLEQFTVSRMIYYSGGRKNNLVKSKVRFVCDFMFPGIDKLDSRYKYAQRYHVLLPVAWIHRLLNNFTRKDLRLNEKLRVLRLMSSSDDYVARSNLLKELGLLD